MRHRSHYTQHTNARMVYWLNVGLDDDVCGEYCTNSINSSVTRHRGSEIDEIPTGHRSQGPATKSPGQFKNWVRFLLEIDFLSS